MNSRTRTIVFSYLMFTCSWITASQQPSINDVFSLWEIDESGTRHDFNPQMSNYKVDINSIIKIEPVPNLVQTLSNGNTSVERRNIAFSPELDRQKQALLELLSQINEQVRLANSLQNIVNRLQSAQSEEEKKLLKEDLSSASKAHGRIGVQRAAVIKSYLKSKGYTGNELNTRFSNIDVRNADFTPLASFLKTQINEIDSAIVLESEHILNRAGRNAIIMSAMLFHNGKSSPIHLPGYDTFDSGEPHLVKKVSFDLTTAEQTRLDEEYEFALRLSTTVNDLRENGKSILAGLTDQGNQLGTSIESLLKEFVSFQVAILSEIEEKIQEVQAKEVENADPRLNTVKTNTAKLAEKVKALRITVATARNAIVSFRDTVLSPAANSNPVMALKKILHGFSESYEPVNNALQLFSKEHAEIAQLIDSIVKEVARVEIASFEDLTTEIHTLFLNSPLVHTILDNIGRVNLLYQEADALTTASDDLELIHGMKPDVLRSPSYLHRQLNDVINTEINLLKTDREEGDLVELTIQVTDGESIIESREVVFEICKFGFMTGVSANAVFLTAVPEDFRRNKKFLMSPVATFMFYYRPWNWDFSPVGLGIHTTTPKFNPDVSIELGIGGSIHLLGDILQAGVGVDISTHPTPGYWYVGIGILDFLSKIKGN